MNIWSHDISQESFFKASERVRGTTTAIFPEDERTLDEPIDLVQEKEFTVDEGYSFIIGLRYLVPIPQFEFLDGFRDKIEDKITLGFVAKPGFDLDLDRKMLFFSRGHRCQQRYSRIRRGIGNALSPWRRDKILAGC